MGEVTLEQQTTGERIRALRDRKAWTQEHMAAAASISVRTVQRAEDGVMSAETLTAIAGALDVPVEQLTGPSAFEPRITPCLFYARADTLDWLVRVFGLELLVAYPSPDGGVYHAELGLGPAKIMVGGPIGDRGWAPPEMSGSRSHSLYVRVEDVDAHCAHARSQGAPILSEPADAHGDRRYLAQDPEGHHWWFATDKR